MQGSYDSKLFCNRRTIMSGYPRLLNRACGNVCQYHYWKSTLMCRYKKSFAPHLPICESDTEPAWRQTGAFLASRCGLWGFSFMRSVRSERERVLWFPILSATTDLLRRKVSTIRDFFAHQSCMGWCCRSSIMCRALRVHDS